MISRASRSVGYFSILANRFVEVALQCLRFGINLVELVLEALSILTVLIGGHLQFLQLALLLARRLEELITRLLLLT
jgi:hypothetical protein